MKRVLGGIAVALLFVSSAANARRNAETEINFWVNDTLIGSVTYGCEGGQYFEWADGVPRTKDESRALAATTQRIEGYKIACPTYTPASWRCIADVDFPSTWEDVVINCPWTKID